MIKDYLTLAGLSLLLLFSNNFILAQENDIELIVKEVNSGVVIEWKISDDNNAHQIILERSVHGTRFNPLEAYDDIPQLLQNKSLFTFLDSQMGMDKVAYRIRIIEEDQSAYFSQTIEINKKIINTYRIAGQELLPQGVFKVTIESIGQNNLEFILIDESGNKMLKEEWSADVGLNDFFIDLDYFQDGAYSAFIKKEKEYQTLTFDKTTRKSDEVAMKNSKWKTKH